MATTVTFSNMLNQYLPEKLLFTEVKKRDWMMNNVEQDDSWSGGSLIVPFLGAVGSTATFGSLAASNDVAEELSVRGTISAYKELWSTMLFNESDLQQHGKLSEQNFLKILPDAIERHAAYVKGVISQNLLTAGYVAKATADGTVGGLITVGQPDRFQIGMKVNFANNVPNTASGYITAINVNTGVLTVKTARSAGSAVDLSAYTVAAVSTIYQDGQQSNGFTSLRDQLLSAANGGSATLLGQTKTAYPFLQSINVDGSSITAANILKKIFDAYVTIRRIGGGSPSNVIMSYKNFGSCISNLESAKGAFNVKPGSQKASAYGWDEIEIGGFASAGLKLVAVQEMDDDIIYFLDMSPSKIKFYTNGGIRRRRNPDGREFYEVRNTTGFQYLVDHSIFGDLVVLQPMSHGILYGISYSI